VCQQFFEPSEPFYLQPSLEAKKKWGKDRLSHGSIVYDTFSRLLSDNSQTGSAEEKARWLRLIRGIMRCLDRNSADNLYPMKTTSHRHLKVSHSNSNAKSCGWEGERWNRR
jgi:hypothetical protein